MTPPYNINWWAIPSDIRGREFIQSIPDSVANALAEAFKADTKRGIKFSVAPSAGQRDCDVLRFRKEETK